MRFFTKKELKVLWPFYLQELTMILFFAWPFMVLYFTQLGFSPSQIGILLGIWPLSSILFEIPTGAIADLYGRKTSVITGMVATGIFMFSIYFFNNYYMIMLLLALSGIFMTLVSGSFEAWTVDLVKANKIKTETYFSKSQSINSFGIVISGLLGALLVGLFGTKIIWIAAGQSFILAGFILGFGKEFFEKKKVRIRDSLKNVWKQSKDSINYGYKHHVLFYLFIIAFVFSVSMSLRSFVAWTPVLTHYGFPDSGYGFLWTGMGILGIFAPLIAGKLIKNKNERKLLIMISFLILLYGISILFLHNVFLLVGLLLFGTFLFDLRMPIRINYFQRFIPNKMRSTIGSVRGLLIGIASVTGMSLSGFLVDWIGGKYTIVVSTLLMIPVILLYFRIKE